MSEPKNPVGRPPHRPTPRQRAIVVKRVASNGSQEMIAEELKISVETLVAHYAQELRDGKYLYRRHLIDLLEEQAAKGSVTAIKALASLTVTVTPGGDDDAPTAAPIRLGKKEQAKIRAEEANRGRFATPEPPQTYKSKTMQ